MNKTFEKIYSENNAILNRDMALKENTALFEKVYAEAEMLNEMNPKLRALLAAGLIGTAGLGATSCSTPNDDPTIYEQPAPDATEETPDNGDNGSGGTEDNGGETQVTFEDLHVSAEDAERIASATRSEKQCHINYLKEIADLGQTVYVYTGSSFKNVKELDDSKAEQSFICYKNASYHYYIPVSMESDFIQAGAPQA